jgi:hypothetical protein
MISRGGKGHSSNRSSAFLGKQKKVCDEEKKERRELEGYIHGKAGRARDVWPDARCEWLQVGNGAAGRS